MEKSASAAIDFDKGGGVIPVVTQAEVQLFL
jgi:hypothetical protein